MYRDGAGGPLAPSDGGRQYQCMVPLLRRLAVASIVALTGCGDGVFIISVNSGVIVGAPQCNGAGGQFDLRDQGGLQVLVVITSSTRIFVSSGSDSCADLRAGQSVEVSGRQSGDRIVAGTITVR